MLHCVVVDDEPGAIEVLENYIRRTPNLVMDGAFRRPVDALNFLTGANVDIVFLDIDMPELNGMQVAGLIHEMNVSIVFCTAYSEFAAESYDYDPVDYLLKPVEYERFLKAIARADRRTRNEASPAGSPPGLLFLKSGSRIHRLDPATVLFVRKDGHYIEFHTPESTIVSRMSMSEGMELLPEGLFARVHRSYVVALSRIDTIHKHSIRIGEAEIPIGERYRKGFLRIIEVSGQ